MTTTKGGRPALAPGEWGSIPTPLRVAEAKYRARTRYCGDDGKIRQIARFGDTAGRAKKNLEAALRAMARERAGVERNTKVSILLDRWVAEIDASNRSAGTKGQYRYFVDTYLRPRMGLLRIGDCTTGRCDELLTAVKDEHGPSVARSLRAVMNGVFGMAVRHDALTVNPVRETQPIHVPKKPARALTVEQVEAITDRLRTDERAVRLDLPDLVDMALATGCRIGELLAITWAAVDLEAGTVDVRATVVRPKGTPGVIFQPVTKTASSTRLLQLPTHAVALLRRRKDELRIEAPEGVIFPNPWSPDLRDPSNAAGDLRDLMDRLGCTACDGTGWHPLVKTKKENKRKHAGVDCWEEPPYPWVTWHTFRKTVATRLEAAGLTPREIADQLGHAQPSMTLNTYLGRTVRSERAASALDR